MTADAPVGVGPNSALLGSPHLNVGVVLAGQVLLGQSGDDLGPVPLQAPDRARDGLIARLV